MSLLNRNVGDPRLIAPLKQYASLTDGPQLMLKNLKMNWKNKRSPLGSRIGPKLGSYTT